jgi:hypothetical protein
MNFISHVLFYFVRLNDVIDASYEKPNNIINTNNIIEPYVNKYMTNYIKKDNIPNFIDKNIDKNINHFLLSNNFNKYNESYFFNKYKKTGSLAQLVHIDTNFNPYVIFDNKLYVSCDKRWIATDNNQAIIQLKFRSNDDNINVYTYENKQLLCYERNNTYLDI